LRWYIGLKALGRISRAPVGAPPASRGGLTAPLALPTGAAESPGGRGMMVKTGSRPGSSKGAGNRYQKKPPTLGHLAQVKATPRQVAAWRRAWEIGIEMTYVGWADPLPMPPVEACKPCLGGIRFWTEAEPPHHGWRCCNCHPAPDNIRIRHWTIDDPVDAAERDAIADEAPERHQPSRGEGVWLDEPETEQKEDDWT